MQILNNIELTEEELEFPTKNKSLAKKRKMDITKALRKKNISKHNYGFDWYSNLHQYSKNKIHCSCGMCRFRNAYDSNVMTSSDKRRSASMNAKLKEYLMSD